MRTLAVLPVKSFGSAKRRLGDAVAAAERRELASAMARDVLDALAAVRGLDGVIVVTAAAGGLSAASPGGLSEGRSAAAPGPHSAAAPEGLSAAAPGRRFAA